MNTKTKEGRKHPFDRSQEKSSFWAIHLLVISKYLQKPKKGKPKRKIICYHLDNFLQRNTGRICIKNVKMMKIQNVESKMPIIYKSETVGNWSLTTPMDAVSCLSIERSRDMVKGLLLLWGEK